MPLSVMVVVLLAAFLHAFWNYLVKNTGDKFVSMSAVVVGHTAAAAVAILVSPLPDLTSLPYMLGGALLHTGYQLLLLNSYRIGDLSHVYPLARGVAPLIVTLVSIMFLGVSLSLWEICGVTAIGTGLISLALVRKSDGLHNSKAAMLATTTGLFIAGYSIVDGMGARLAGTSLGFYGWLSMINAVLYILIMRFLRPGLIRRSIVGNWRLSLAGGGASFVAYGMVIWAFTMAPLALVTALRETSIIFALLLGVFVLKERLDLLKVVATVLTLLGVGMMRLSR